MIQIHFKAIILKVYTLSFRYWGRYR